MKIWASRVLKQNRNFTTGILLSFGFALLINILIAFGGALLLVSSAGGKELISISYLLGVIVIFVCVFDIRRRVLLNRMIFFQSDDGRFFVLDIALLVRYRRAGIGAFLITLRKIQAIAKDFVRSATLKKLCEKGRIPDMALQILEVRTIIKRPMSYRIDCRVQHSNGQLGNHTILMQKGYEEEGSLLNILESMKKSV